jgi:hypothetical protein
VRGKGPFDSLPGVAYPKDRPVNPAWVMRYE